MFKNLRQLFCLLIDQNRKEFKTAPLWLIVGINSEIERLKSLILHGRF